MTKMIRVNLPVFGEEAAADVHFAPSQYADLPDLVAYVMRGNDKIWDFRAENEFWSQQAVRIVVHYDVIGDSQLLLVLEAGPGGRILDVVALSSLYSGEVMSSEDRFALRVAAAEKNGVGYVRYKSEKDFVSVSTRKVVLKPQNTWIELPVYDALKHLYTLRTNGRLKDGDRVALRRQNGLYAVVTIGPAMKLVDALPERGVITRLAA